MKLYNAGIYTAGFKIGGSLWERLTDNEKWQRVYAGDRHLLESFHYVGKQNAVDMIRADGRQIFLDSGAFSMWSLGVKVDIPKYCAYIQENDDIIRKDDGVILASVMDAIGDALGTYQNQMLMESMGVRPLPCFHFGEDFEYLKHYIKNYSYITLGGMVAQSTEDLKIWLDEIWEKYLTDGTGHAIVKVHGFGLTTESLMIRYPWYSVDSSRWVQAARVGNVFVLPENGNPGKIITISKSAPRQKVNGQHLNTMLPVYRQAIERRLIAEGLDLERAGEIYLARWCYNMYAFAKFGEIITADKENNPRFIPDQLGLF